MPKNPLSRREFVKQTSAFSALALTGLGASSCADAKPISNKIQIEAVNSDFEREPLIKPFGFKGSAMTRVWQIASWMRSSSGTAKIGLGTQNVLWSDSRVFANHSENGGNALMYAMTERAMQLAKGRSFNDPIELLDELLEEVFEYGKSITQQADLRKTFALNALVPVDNAAWLLYAAENGFNQFDEMIPATYRSGIAHRHTKVASIPALSYGTSMETIKELADQGFFIMKIKIGAPGTQEEMLEKDKEFISAIHKTIGHYETEHTPDGKLPYYFDANGRYEEQETLMKFLDHAEKIGALEQIAVVEEPFGERNQKPVHEIAARGPRVAADESAHTDEDARARIEQGYNSIALKAIAKTLSMTLKIAQIAHEADVPCFCADLTVNPILVDWNKNIAARLSPFPGLDFGLQETNGWQNYRNWATMKSYHPKNGSAWTNPENGVFVTGKDFYEESGGVMMPSAHYEEMFK